MNPISLGSSAILKSTSPTAPVGGTADPTATATTPAGVASDSAADASDRFLKLLVTQLRNQDPLNPLDNAEITTQLAQISTVSGINKLNDTVASLASSFAASQYLQSASLIGHDAVLAGNGIDLKGGSATGGLNLTGAADKVTVTITDAAGAVVRTITLGAQPAGTQFFNWDGKNDAGGAAPEGRYSFSATATKGSDAVAATTLSIAHVDGIVPGASGTVLQMSNGTQVALADVLEIR